MWLNAKVNWCLMDAKVGVLIGITVGAGLTN